MLDTMPADNLLSLPTDLPAPQDDGACDHLRDMMLPAISLQATSGARVDLTQQGAPWVVVYCYPRTGCPGQELPGGAEAWNAIPGARGCSPQSCAYRDHYAELQALGANVYGLSTQDSDYQKEAAERLELPFPLLSDAQLSFAQALRLPTFRFAGLDLIKRLTLIIRAGRIEEVFYPVFPSDSDATHVLAWLSAHQKQ